MIKLLHAKCLISYKIKELLEAFQTEWGEQALFTAIEEKKYDLAAALVGHMDPPLLGVQNEFGETALMLAIHKDQDALAMQLAVKMVPEDLNKETTDAKKTALVLAVIKGKRNLARVIQSRRTANESGVCDNTASELMAPEKPVPGVPAQERDGQQISNELHGAIDAKNLDRVNDLIKQMHSNDYMRQRPGINRLGDTQSHLIRVMVEMEAWSLAGMMIEGMDLNALSLPDLRYSNALLVALGMEQWDLASQIVARLGAPLLAMCNPDHQSPLEIALSEKQYALATQIGLKVPACTQKTAYEIAHPEEQTAPEKARALGADTLARLMDLDNDTADILAEDAAGEEGASAADEPPKACGSGREIRPTRQ